MISYSDYVLAQNPWGYWPLNDASLTVYDETHQLIDCSGNERHLTASKTGITYKVAIPHNDSLPLEGVLVNPTGGRISEFISIIIFD